MTDAEVVTRAGERITTASLIRTRWTGGPTWAAASAVVAWTLATVVVVLYNPGTEPYWRQMTQPPFTCNRTVGHAAGCDVAIQMANDAWNWLHIYPLLGFIVLGYVGIWVMASRGRRRAG